MELAYAYGEIEKRLQKLDFSALFRGWNHLWRCVKFLYFFLTFSIRLAKKFSKYIWHFAHLFVPLHPKMK